MAIEVAPELNDMKETRGTSRGGEHGPSLLGRTAAEDRGDQRAVVQHHRRDPFGDAAFLHRAPQRAFAKRAAPSRSSNETISKGSLGPQFLPDLEGLENPTSAILAKRLRRLVRAGVIPVVREEGRGRSA